MSSHVYASGGVPSGREYTILRFLFRPLLVKLPAGLAVHIHTELVVQLL